MSDFPDWRDIDRYLTGGASPDERARIDTWLDADSRRAAMLDVLRLESGASAPVVDVDRAWARFERNRPTEQPGTIVPFRGGTIPRVWQIAAAAVLIVGVGAIWQTVRRGRVGSAVESPNGLVAAASTANGQRKTITLSDGTRVTLNGGTVLRLGRAYGERARDVYLDGEGYFEVTHDAARPFRVHAQAAIAEDLGTRFVVHAYARQPIEVAVTDGLVSLKRDGASPGDSVHLAAGDVGALAGSGPPTVSHGAALDRYTAWIGGSLVLDGMTLRDAAQELERWYDVRIAVPDSALATRTVVARLHGESADQALYAIALALGAHVEQNGSSYTLLPKRQ